MPALKGELPRQAVGPETTRGSGKMSGTAWEERTILQPCSGPGETEAHHGTPIGGRGGGLAGSWGVARHLSRRGSSNEHTARRLFILGRDGSVFIPRPGTRNPLGPSHEKWIW